MARRGHRATWLVRGVAGVALALIVAGCNGTMWPMLGFDETHSGDNSQETAIGVANVGTLVEAGSTRAVKGPIKSAPTTANGIVYVTADLGSRDVGTLYAYSATGAADCNKRHPATCRPLWSATPAGAHKLLSSPAVDASDGIVYVGSANGVLYAYNATTGALAWQSPLMGGSVGSSPTISDEYVYISIVYGWTFAYPLTTGYDGENPSCTSRGTGQRICRPSWRYHTPGDVYSSPAIADGIFYSNVSTPTDKLYAYDDELDGHCSGSAYAVPLGATCANPLWTANTGGGKSSPTVAGGTVYLGSVTGGLLAFSATGSTDCSGLPYTYLQGMKCTPLWTAVTGRQDASSPAISDGLVYLGSRDGHLDAFDASSGALRWQDATGGAIDAAPTIADGVVYVGCSNRYESKGQTCSANLYGFDATSGALLWSNTTGGSTATVDVSPVIADTGGNPAAGVVFVGSSSGPTECVGAGKCSGRVFAFGLP